MRLLVVTIGLGLSPETQDDLRSMGHQIETATSAKRGLVLVCSAAYDAILVDSNTVDSTWIEHARTVGPLVPTVAIRTSEQDPDFDLRFGLDGLVPPDVTAKELIEAVGRLGDLRRMLFGRRPDQPVVLLAEDDPALLRSLASLLRRRAFQVVTAGDGASALRLLRQKSIQIVVADHNMPRVTGTQLAAAARCFDPRLVPILMTGDRNLETAVEAVRSGSMDVLFKPLDPEELLDAVERAWSRWRIREHSGRFAVADEREVMRVLVVEDQAADAVLVKRRLKAIKTEQWLVDWVTNLADAIEHLGREHYQAVLLDLGLPDATGPETFLRIQAHSRDTAIIVLTGDNDQERVREVMTLGAQEYLYKGDATGVRLASRIRYAVERRQLLRKLDELVVNLQGSDTSRLDVVDNGNRAVVVISGSGEILEANHAAQFLFDRYGSELIGGVFPTVVTPGEVHDFEVVRRSGEIRTLQTQGVPTDWNGEAALLLSLADVTIRRQSEQALLGLAEQLTDANQRLKLLATRDPLTGVLNRRGLETSMNRELETVRRKGANMAVCLIDCDDFKQVNDEHGHGTGDLVLRRIADTINEAVRGSDVVARIGGDEFLFLMPSTTLAEAYLVAERVRVAVASEPVVLGERPCRVTVSVGVASVPWDTRSIEELLVLTRSSIQSSKRHGKNCVTGAMDVVEGRHILTDPKSFRVVAQPIVSLADERVYAYELLTRGPEGQFESPYKFLRAARQEKMLTVVDMNCLRACLRATHEFPPGTRLSLNVFPTTLLDLSTESLISLLSERSDCDLWIELSEEQFVGDPEELVERLDCIRSLGIHIVIDDIGSGHGTLDSVMLLEPKLMKLDRQLVDGAHRDQRKQRLLKRVTKMAKGLETEIVAEGIEDRADAEVLRSFGIKYGQGYLWSKPLPIPEILKVSAELPALTDVMAAEELAQKADA